MNFKIIIGLILMSFLLVAGCIGNASSGSPSYVQQPVYSTPIPTPVPQPILNAKISSFEEHWSVGLGYYYTVSGYVYNSGNAADQDVNVCVKLIDKSSNAIRDSKNVYVGSLPSGDSQNFEVTLDGESGHSYSAQVVIN